MNDRAVRGLSLFLVLCLAAFAKAGASLDEAPRNRAAFATTTPSGLRRGLAEALRAKADKAPDGTSQASPTEPAVSFEHIGRAAGLDFQHINGASPDKHIVETMGSGGLFADFDGDGWLDIFVVDGGSVADRQVAGRARHRLYRNRGNGTFEDVTSASRIVHREYGLGACAADYDNDGRVDLYITNFGPNVLYHNDGHGIFSDVTKAAAVGSSLMSTSCAFSDIDADGDLDLFVVNYVDPEGNSKICGNNRFRGYCRPQVYKGVPSALYRNNGNGTFTDVTKQAGLYRTDGKGLGVVFGDYDNDGRPDVFVANDLTPNFLYHNEGRGVFSDVGLLAGVAVASDGKTRAGMGTDFADYNGDGLLDLVVTNFELEAHNIFRNLGGGLFADATFESGIGAASLPFLGFGVVFLDYDNDADLDLTIANGHVLDNTREFRATSKHAQRKLLLRNDGTGKLMEVGLLAGRGFATETVGRTLVAGDIDNDGDLDLLVTNNGQPADLIRNDGGNRSNAVLLRVIGKESNRDGIGTRIRALTGTRMQVREVKAGSSYLGQNDTRVHLGLGGAARIDRLEVRWPSGRMEVIQNVPANHIVTLMEGQGATDRTPFVRR